MNPSTGAVVAVYGGKNYAKEYNAATYARVQAGSTFKPFGLVAALDEGKSLYTTYDGSSPQQYTLEDGSTYPDPATDPEIKAGRQGGIRNSSDGAASGPVSLLRATEDSVNTAFVGMNLDVGPKKTREAAVKLGLPKDTQGLGDSPINILGVASPRVIDMATAYSTLANRGVKTKRHTIQRVENAGGGLLYEVRVVPKRVFPERVVDDAVFAMQHVVTQGTGTAAQGLDRPSAGKTGTTDDYMSAWYIGFTPQLVTAVAMFRETDGVQKSLRGVGGLYSFYGGGFPADVWTAYMVDALEDEPVDEFARPVFGGSAGPGDGPARPRSTSRPTASVGSKPSGSPTPKPSSSSAPSPSATKSPSPEPSTPDPEPEP
jgi:membrane peptidoglycan carboxypeptidase